MRFQRRNASEAHLIQQAAGDDLDAIRQEIATGVAEFFSLGALHVVTRSEITTRGRELVVVCTQGTGFKEPVRLLLKTARVLGYEFIRFHPTTKGRGLATARIARYPATWVEEPDSAYFIADLRG